MSENEVCSAFITFNTLISAQKAAHINLPQKNHVPFKLERTLAPKPSEYASGGISGSITPNESDGLPQRRALSLR
jgi:hypothetical protein